MAHDAIHWTCVSFGMPIAESLVAGYCFCRLAQPFMENKKGACHAGAAYVLTMLIIYSIPMHFAAFIAYGIGVFMAFLVMCWMEQRNYGQKAFIAVTFFSLRWFTSAMAEILYDKLYNFAGNTHYMAAHPNMSFALYVGVCVFYLVSEFLFTAVSIWCILKNYVYKHAGMSTKELFVLVIPSFMGVAGYEAIWCYRSFYIAEIGKTSDVYDILSLGYYTIAVITIVVVIALYQSIKAGQEEKLQNELLATQIDSIGKHIEQVERLYKDIGGIKHDMTNHIITLERLYAGKKMEEAIAYSTELKAALSEVTGNINSGNPVTDVILQEMGNEAEKRKIRFDTDFHYPTGSDVNAFDISVILNNALQNALENTVGNEMSYISIISYRSNNAYMIEISNSFAGNLQWDTEKELPITSKSKTDSHGYGQTHGYGLANIRRVAEKYSGDIDIVLRDGEFCLIIMLMLE